jgi:hypothetical protein
MESGQEGGDKVASADPPAGQEPYSPSTPSNNDEEPMDWTSNLSGVKLLLSTAQLVGSLTGGQLIEGPTGTNQSDNTTSAGSDASLLMPPPPPPPPRPVPAPKGMIAVSLRALNQKAAALRTTPRAVPGASTSTTTTTTTTTSTTTTTTPTPSPPATMKDNEASAVERAKEFIKAAAEKKLKEILEALGEDALAYNVIRKANIKKHRLKDLKSGDFTYIADCGTFLSTLDGRMRIVEVAVILGQHESWTYSFRLRMMECIGCPLHVNHTPFPRRGTNIKGGRQAIWLSDQSMPPILPVLSQQQCIKIVRLENGTLQGLAEGLVRTLSGRQVAAGSTVLMTSVTNMTAAGPSGYADDLLRAIRFLRRSMGDHLVYGPLPNLFMGGCNDPITIRTAYEVTMWAKSTLNDNCMLTNSFQKVEKLLIKRCGGSYQADHKQTLRFPTADGNNLLSYTSGGWDKLPSKLPSCPVGDEQEAVSTMIEEIWDKMAVDLDLTTKVDRWPAKEAADPADGSKKSFLLIGSSHAGKIGSSLRKLGHYADVIYQSNWRATKESVMEMSEAINAKLEATRVDSVVYCVLDNNVYYGVDEGGNSKLAARDADGVYHIEGNLTLSSKSAQHILLTSLKPMFDAGRGRNIIVCAPMPRYLKAGCCANEEHVANRKQSGYEANLLRDLKDTAENVRDFMFTSSHKSAKVLDPAVSWRQSYVNDIWGVDPVHPTEAAYALLAEGLLHICNIMESGARKRARTNSIETGVQASGSTLNRQQGGRGARGGGGHQYDRRSGPAARRGGRRGN